MIKIFYNLQGTLQGGNSTDFGHTTIANLDPKVKYIFGKKISFLKQSTWICNFVVRLFLQVYLNKIFVLR